MTHIIDPQYRKRILKLAKQVGRTYGYSMNKLGAEIVNDGDFFKNLENGADCKAATLVKVEAWLNGAIDYHESGKED
jgi:hypothetical protein